MKHYCPVNDGNCPYWNKDCTCQLDDPFNECDDFTTFWDEDDESWEEE